ncbi:unnamed protein product [Arctogadus glacialis]
MRGIVAEKQGTTNLASYRVLRADQSFILSLLDQAVETANSCSFLQVIATLGQFGQRDPDVLQLGDLVLAGSVESVSVHLASKVLAVGEDTHLLLSRHGLLPLIGVRGSLFSTLGMHEMCNFQSNLNTLRTDVGQAIKCVLSKTGEVAFLQLYADAPHIHYNQPFKYPVSGVLVTCGFSHPNVKATLTSRALAYLKHIRDLRLRLVCQLVRFEGEDVPFEFDPREFFDLPALQRLFQDRALLVPFQDREDGRGLLSTLRGVVSHLAGILGESFRDSEGVGRYDPSWKAFQASHNSASLEESPPPLHHWTRDPLQETRIERLWALCQCVEAGPALLRAALIRVLLGDLYKRNDQLPCTSLKSDTTPGRLTGATDVKKLAADLATKESFPVPVVEINEYILW